MADQKCFQFEPPVDNRKDWDGQVWTKSAWAGKKSAVRRKYTEVCFLSECLDSFRELAIIGSTSVITVVVETKNARWGLQSNGIYCIIIIRTNRISAQDTRQ